MHSNTPVNSNLSVGVVGSRHRPPATSSTTTFPAVLARKRTLVLLDAENISFSASKSGQDCAYGLLSKRLADCIGRPQLHAFCSADNAEFATDYFRQNGWIPHVQRGRGNSDMNLALTTAFLTLQEQPDALLLISGDGDLGIGLLRFLEAASHRTQLHTMGIAKSFSRRLIATASNGITSTTFLGPDMFGAPIH